jgi:hypothetical protein
MRPIFIAQHRTHPRPWYRYLAFPFLLIRWAFREAKEGADELWDELSPPT